MSPASAARARVARVRSALPARDPATRTRLAVLAPPATARRRPPFAAACAAVLVASLLGVLVLNIVLARGAYDEHVLELRRTELTEREQELSERLSVQASPAVLSERARGLGMVPNVNPAFLRLADGTVLGAPTPAGADVPLGASIPPVDLDAPAGATGAAEAAAAAEAARVQAEQDRLDAAPVDQPAGGAGDASDPAGGGDGATGADGTSGASGTSGSGGSAGATPPPAGLGDGAVSRGTGP